LNKRVRDGAPDLAVKNSLEKDFQGLKKSKRVEGEKMGEGLRSYKVLSISSA